MKRFILVNTGEGTFNTSNPISESDVVKIYDDSEAGETGIYAPIFHSHLWADITGKPTTFTPSAHTHLWADITDKPTTFAPSEHTHPGLTAGTGLNGGKYNGGSSNTFTFDTVWGDARYLTSLPAHSHSWSQITSKPTTFNPTAHTHDWTEVLNKPILDNYASWKIQAGAGDTGRNITSGSTLTLIEGTGITFSRSNNDITINASTGTGADGNNYLTGVSGSGNGTVTFTRDGLANLSWSSAHSHSWSQITSKPNTFNPISHTHPWSDITDVPSFDNYASWKIKAGTSDGGRNITSGNTVTLIGGTGIDITRINNDFTISATGGGGGGTADGNTYPTGVSVSGTTTKTLTLTMNEGANLTATFPDLNTTYSEISVSDINSTSSSSARLISGRRLNAWGVPKTGGTFTGNISAPDFVGSSDKRLKENIIEVEPTEIKSKYKRFNFIGNQQERIGVVAQELEEVHPEFVRTDEKGIKSVSYTDLHSAEIVYLKKENKELKERLEKLEKLLLK